MNELSWTLTLVSVGIISYMLGLVLASRHFKKVLEKRVYTFFKENDPYMRREL